MEILRRRYRIRPQGDNGQQITLPPGCFETGGDATVHHDRGFALIVRAEKVVDEDLLRKALGADK